MSEALAHEMVAINSIYGEETLKSTEGKMNDEEGEICIIYLPRQDTWLKLFFPSAYPSVAPIVLGTQGTGEQVHRRDAKRACSIFDQALKRLFRPGDVCLFDVLEEMSAIADLESQHQTPSEIVVQSCANPITRETTSESSTSIPHLLSEPVWCVSDPMSELKSVFVARSSRITAVTDVSRYRQHLLDHEKKVASATHNIMAWRIRSGTDHDTCHNNHTDPHSREKRKASSSRKIEFHTDQDYDDDGESAAGSRLLHLMQLMDVWNVMVIVTRWYGGVKLGKRRFTLINAVARDALLKIDQL